ncbi:MAG: HlyD family type I secretion periplasmic adaptor subunit [Rhodospirillaceae bacterium]|nr:HlyD family type I secretion periplasmic adaptor subunit [Rhodospirillaceae bacterium]MBT5243242.1 HlyD family type I secretion periplasmic adaptor subunit [Rhodospirillaceae bacterium]MBT5563974.1 HlyD family type I secretion periplasmic adaptor subunit [Rhodospirillaceae bacterium]MBT6240822.1 HlyD family type I secretion periplasmic adaptor subunit [Rhodospirillaceae bacterium]MBT7136614.1 HlyD family type I secretion periplasmic adaptor subunit [Rhodospirillaceae bacterium]
MPSWRLAAWPVMIMMALILTWSNFTKLEEVTVTDGEVIPLGDFQTIQHLEGGIVKEIHVRDGQIVDKGAALILLDLATSGVNREELQVRLDGQILLKARLEAEAQGKRTITFPEEAAKRRPEQLAAQRQNFEARRRQLASTIGALGQAVKQRRQDVKELDAQIRAVKKNLNLAKKRFAMSKNLLKDGLTPEMEHLQLEAEVESLEGETQTLIPSLSRAKSAISEAESRVNEERNRFRSGAREELVQAEQALGRINELLTSADEQGLRAMIKSPIDGVVQNMKYNTIGGVIRPGEPIMEIVPTGASMVIDAKLKPADRAFVTVDQRVMVKLSTYDYAIFGGLEGKVTMVAPDTVIDEKGEPYFRIFVKTDKTYIGDDPDLYKITPGMQATVDIHTGEKSVMEYLIMPVLKLKSEAFRER